MNSILSKRLKQLRIENNMYQKDVAKKIGITESGYGYYEQDKRIPDSIMLNKLAAEEYETWISNEIVNNYLRPLQGPH